MKESFVHCSACVAILGTMKRLVKIPGARKLLGRLAISACMRYEYGGNTTCSQTINAHEEHFYNVIKDSQLSAKQMCQRLDFCQMPVLYDQIQEPPVYKGNGRPSFSKGGSILNVTHLSDVHIDPSYRVGGRVDCGEVLCCRNQTTDGLKASPFGEPYCDIPSSFLDTLKDLLTDRVFITGDIGAHDVWNTDLKDLLESHQRCRDKIAPGREIWLVMGNHDLIPANYFVYNSTDPRIMSDSKMLLKKIREIWDLPEEFEKAGYYRKDLDGFCVLAINTNLYYHFNAHRLYYYPDSDPIGQWQWLTGQIQNCSPRPLILLAHGPPGTRDHSLPYLRQLSLLFKNYPNKVHIFTGHTHTDYFKVISGNAVSWTSPSLTTWLNWTSAVRHLHFDPGTGSLKDMRTFLFSKKDELWKESYRWSTAYGLPDASARSVRLLIALIKVDQVRQQLFCKHYLRLPDIPIPECQKVIQQLFPYQ